MNLYDLTLSAGLSSLRVWSDTVNVDNYEPERVFGPGGFLAESFIKPPVNLFVSFGFPFVLHRLRFCPKVGSQTSLGFDVAAALFDGDDEVDIDVPRKRVHSESNSLVESVGSAKTKTEPEVDSAGSLGSGSRTVPFSASMAEMQALDFKRLNRVSLSPTDSHFNTVDFANGIRVSRQHWDPWTQELRHSRPIDLGRRRRKRPPPDAVRVLRFCVFRTLGMNVPGMRSLEIIGEPMWDWMVKDMRRSLEVAVERLNSSQAPPESASDSTMAPSASPRVVVESSKDEFDPDSEFLDAITYRIMTIPMLLPSGYNVDLTTLERHESEEAKWGRRPNDPFTAVAFTEKSKPLPNDALKSRIDAFLARTSHAHDFPRTLGRRDDVASKPGPPPLGIQIVPGILTPDETTTTTIDSAIDGTVSTSGVSGSSTNSSSHPSTSTNPKRPHEDIVRQSLDDALDAVLRQSVRSRPRPSSVQPSCALCDVVIVPFHRDHRATQFQRSYKLICGHFLCSHCLESINFQMSVSCPRCDREITRSDIQRTHLP